MWNWLMGLVVSKFKDYVLTNWKTSLIAALGWLFAHVVGPKLGLGTDQQQEILKLISDFILPLGLLSKDADKTGTAVQPRTDPAVVSAQNAAALVASGPSTYKTTFDAEIERNLAAGG